MAVIGGLFWGKASVELVAEEEVGGPFGGVDPCDGLVCVRCEFFGCESDQCVESDGCVSVGEYMIQTRRT